MDLTAIGPFFGDSTDIPRARLRLRYISGWDIGAWWHLRGKQRERFARTGNKFSDLGKRLIAYPDLSSVSLSHSIITRLTRLCKS